MNKSALALLFACWLAAGLGVAQVAFAAAPDTVNAGNTDSTQTGGTSDPNYRIQEEDVLRLDVWGESQLTNIQMLVTPDGMVNVPYIGPIKAEGMTQGQLITEIVKRLADAGIVYDAKAQISILQMHKPTVWVLGAVTRPGQIEFKEGDTVMEAIAGAGSYKDDGWLEKTTLTRKGNEKPISINLREMLGGDMSQNIVLQKGDTIYIPPEDYQNKIYVLGHVTRPGIYPLRDRTMVLSAISLAGGATERGMLKSTMVIRGGPAKPQKVECNLTKLFDKADMKQDILLQPGDVVMVPETNKPDWNKISSILGTVLNLTYLRRYGLY